MMRVSKYLKSEIQKASLDAFGERELILFGSRIDETKRGGDFDIAVVKDMSIEAFKKAKVQVKLDHFLQMEKMVTFRENTKI
jgi:predicted nucleotidyltransferase